MAVVGKGSRTANADRVAQGTEDVNFTLPNNADHIILGCGVGDDNGDKMSGGATVRLEFRTGVDAFATVVAGSGAVRLGNTDLIDGNNLNEGERLSTGTFGPYDVGKELETTNPGTQSGKVHGEHTEYQWSLDFNTAPDSTTYDFRVFWDHDGGGNVVDYISIITAGGGGNGGPPAFLPEQLDLTPMTGLH